MRQSEVSTEITPDEIRRLAASVSWQDRQDVKDGMLEAARTIERLEHDLDGLTIQLKRILDDNIRMKMSIKED